MKKEGSLTLAEGLIDPDYRLQKTEIAWCKDAGFELAEGHGSPFFYVLTFKVSQKDLMTKSYIS